MEADCNIDEVVLVKVSLSLSPGSLYFSLQVCYWSLCILFQSSSVLLESVYIISVFKCVTGVCVYYFSLQVCYWSLCILFQSSSVLLESVYIISVFKCVTGVCVYYFSLQVCYWSLCMKWRKTVTLTRGFLWRWWSPPTPTKDSTSVAETRPPMHKIHILSVGSGISRNNWLSDWLMITYIALFSSQDLSWADILCSHVVLHEWLAFYSTFLNIHRSGALTLTALAWLVPHETVAVLY